jgi:hypothetical protein
MENREVMKLVGYSCGVSIVGTMEWYSRDVSCLREHYRSLVKMIYAAIMVDVYLLTNWGTIDLLLTSGLDSVTRID